LNPPLAAIFGCAGTVLAAEERDLFRSAQPLGFILFARNCENPDQVRALTADLRQSVGREDAPVLIDEEGGRVQRLKPPQWRDIPAPAAFGELYDSGAMLAREATRLNARIMAAELNDLGIDVDCTPVLDLRLPGASEVVGNRALDGKPEIVADLGRAVCDGLLDGGVLPVIKHMPGHGRAAVDSHLELPVVDLDRTELTLSDFAPFRALADMPVGITAHVVYTAVDAAKPGTTSTVVINDIIRGWIGFQGFLMSDDLSMEALSGTISERAAAAVEAGCDVALHCNGKLDEMQSIADRLPPMTESSLDRWEKARAARRLPDSDFDLEEALGRLNLLMGGTT